MCIECKVLAVRFIPDMGSESRRQKQTKSCCRLTLAAKRKAINKRWNSHTSPQCDESTPDREVSLVKM